MDVHPRQACSVQWGQQRQQRRGGAGSGTASSVGARAEDSGSPSCPSARYFLVARLYVASVQQVGGRAGRHPLEHAVAQAGTACLFFHDTKAVAMRRLPLGRWRRAHGSQPAGAARTWPQVGAADGHTAGHDALPGGAGRVKRETHARHLREPPLQLGPLADPVLQGRQQLCACRGGRGPQDRPALHGGRRVGGGASTRALRAVKRLTGCPAVPTCDLDFDRVVQHGQDAAQVAVGQLAGGVDAVCACACQVASCHAARSRRDSLCCRRTRRPDMAGEHCLPTMPAHLPAVQGACTALPW